MVSVVRARHRGNDGAGGTDITQAAADARPTAGAAAAADRQQGARRTAGVAQRGEHRPGGRFQTAQAVALAQGRCQVSEAVSRLHFSGR